jgi:hypothetical protein
MRSSRRVSWTGSRRLRLGAGRGPLILLALLVPTAMVAASEVRIQDRRGSTPLVLDRPEDYVLRNVRIASLTDLAALTLSGQIKSVTIESSKFGDIRAGGNHKAAAMEAVAATVGAMTVSDSAFYDAENQLVSLRDGSFGTVTFLHCTFKTSEAFLKRVYAENPWRTAPPTTEFYNIERLELLDNEFNNTTIIIHPSVKTVVLRGDVSRLLIESPNTQVIRLEPDYDQILEPGFVLPSDVITVAETVDTSAATGAKPQAPLLAGDQPDTDPVTASGNVGTPSPAPGSGRSPHSP